MWYFTNTNKVNQETLEGIIDHRLTEFEKQLLENFENGAITSDSTTVSWSFLASIVYCFTVFTTIGE